MKRPLYLLALLWVGALVGLLAAPAAADPGGPIAWGSWQCQQDHVDLTVTVQNTSQQSATYDVRVGPWGPNEVTVAAGGTATSYFRLSANGAHDITLTNKQTGDVTRRTIDRQGSTIVCNSLQGKQPDVQAVASDPPSATPSAQASTRAATATMGDGAPSSNAFAYVLIFGGIGLLVFVILALIGLMIHNRRQAV